MNTWYYIKFVGKQIEVFVLPNLDDPFGEDFEV